MNDGGTPPFINTQYFTVTVNPLAPVVLTPVGLTGDRFTVSVAGPIGPDYVLQSSVTLSDWISLRTNRPVSTPFSVTDTNAGGFSKRFYRMLLGP